MEESSKYKLLILDKRIKGLLEGYRQNIALLGNDGEEIACLLERYLKENKLEGIIYIHTSTLHVNQEDFLKSVIISLLSEYTGRIDSLDRLITHASVGLENTVDFIKKILKKNEVSFLEVVEVVNKFINETGRKCVLIIEEFLKLDRIFPKYTRDFSKFIILQRNCMVVLASSCSREAEKVLSSGLNLLFGNFEKVNLDERPFLNNYTYLKQQLYPLKPSPFFLSFFVKVIGGNVIYYDLFVDSIKRNYSQYDEEGVIISSIEEVLCLKESYLFQRFMRRIDLIEVQLRDPSAVLKILLSISEGYLRKKELVSLGLCRVKEFEVKLQRLINLNYVESLGNLYRITDPLFSFWLSHVFKLCFSPPLLDYKARRSLWRNKMKEEIELFKEEFFKNKLKKILGLLASFKDDSLKLGRNRYRLPSIEKTKVISYPQRSLHLIIGEGKEVIFMGVKERKASDDDIIEFIEKGGKVKGKGVKKIFVSLQGFSPSARLIAKNNKLTVWDANEVNSLLNIYNKSLIPL